MQLDRGTSGTLYENVVQQKYGHADFASGTLGFDLMASKGRSASLATLSKFPATATWFMPTGFVIPTRSTQCSDPCDRFRVVISCDFWLVAAFIRQVLRQERDELQAAYDSEVSDRQGPGS